MNQRHLSADSHGSEDKETVSDASWSVRSQRKQTISFWSQQFLFQSWCSPQRPLNTLLEAWYALIFILNTFRLSENKGTSHRWRNSKWSLEHNKAKLTLEWYLFCFLQKFVFKSEKNCPTEDWTGKQLGKASYTIPGFKTRFLLPRQRNSSELGLPLFLESRDYRCQAHLSESSSAEGWVDWGQVCACVLREMPVVRISPVCPCLPSSHAPTLNYHPPQNCTGAVSLWAFLPMMFTLPSHSCPPGRKTPNHLVGITRSRRERISPDTQSCSHPS